MSRIVVALLLFGILASVAYAQEGPDLGPIRDRDRKKTKCLGDLQQALKKLRETILTVKESLNENEMERVHAQLRPVVNRLLSLETKLLKINVMKWDFHEEEADFEAAISQCKTDVPEVLRLERMVRYSHGGEKSEEEL